MGTMASTADWRRMAVIEVEEEWSDLHDLIAEPRLNYEFRANESSPGGYRWLDLRVDGSRGEYRAARTAWAVLNSLQRLARDGMIGNVRIVVGGEWLNIGQVSPPFQQDGATLPG